MAPKAKPDPKDFVLMNKKDEKIIREPGTLMGYDFLIDGCEGCEVRLMDNTSQVQVDYCKDCKILIGPVGGSVFLRNCERCIIFAACQQLRTRECCDCEILLIIPGTPIIESSKNMRFGPLPADVYPELQAQLPKSLAEKPNEWNKVYDFSPNDPPGGGHWSLLSADEASSVLAQFQAEQSSSNDPKSALKQLLSAAVDNGRLVQAMSPSNAVEARPDENGAQTLVSTEPSTATPAGGVDPAEEAHEVRVSVATGARRCATAVRCMLFGSPESEEVAAKKPVPRVALTGLGAATVVAATVAAILEHEGSARILSVATDLVATSGRRPAPHLRIIVAKKIEDP